MEYRVISKPQSGLVFPKIISLDTEYSEQDIKKAELLSISIGVSPDLTYILESFKAVRPFLEAADAIFTWNGVVDSYMLTKSGFPFPKQKMIDAMLMEHLVNERLDHGLGDFALREYNDNYKTEFWSRHNRYQDSAKEDAYDYEMRDGCYTYRAGVKYSKDLASRWPLVEHAHKLQWALFDTEVHGLKVNVDLLTRTRDTMKAEIEGYAPLLRSEYGEYVNLWELKKWREEIAKRVTDRGKSGVRRPEFNFASDAQQRWLIYDAMECPVHETTKKGSPKTDYDTLSKLVTDYPGLSTLAKYKETKAVYSTFVEGMLERVQDGRIYPSFYINGTTTGRISHANPNMGNLPRDGVIRNFFIPEEGNAIVGADYSQLEVVIEANLTEDRQLLKIILEGASKHDITAQGLGIPRDSAKTLNFALQYGAGVHKISKLLGVSTKEAGDIFKRYWELYAGVYTLKEKTCKELKEKGEVTNIFGRTRHFDKPKNEFEKAKQERQAYNHLIQGPGSDMMNMAAYEISGLASKNGWGRLWFTVHDEAVTECKKALVERAKADIVLAMGIPNQYLNLKYPVDCKLYGPLDCWGKA